jgi:hypothetical protein
MKELLPNLARVVMLFNSTNPYSAVAVPSAQRGAAALNIALDLADASAVSDLETALQRANLRRRDDGGFAHHCLLNLRGCACGPPSAEKLTLTSRGLGRVRLAPPIADWYAAQDFPKSRAIQCPVRDAREE